MYNYVRGRQLEGTYDDNPTTGMWPVSSHRVMRGWGMPPEESWPYDGDASHWPPKEEPPSIDEFAKQNRLFAYQQAKSADDFALALAQKLIPLPLRVQLSVEISDSWYDASDGHIRMPGQGEEPSKGHSIILVSYNKRKRIFKFLNSWGREWGDKGYGYLPHQYVNSFMTEGWVSLPYPDKGQARKGGEKQESTVDLQWGVLSPLGGVLHGAEIRQQPGNDYIAWAFAAKYDGYLNVEELFVHPRFRHGGYGRRLFKEMQALSLRLSVPLRLWISHVDAAASNLATIRHILEKDRFILNDAGVRWASYKAQK
ncbi:MAG: C1 family peptidase [Desulfomonilaceae bacterium]